jgi:segregation and condensation protein A
VYDGTRLAEAMGGLLRHPPAVDVRHMAAPKVSVAERLAHLRELLRRGRFSFEEAVSGANRVTVAVTLFAVLELYKQGELTWSQQKPFGEIVIEAAGRRAERPAAAGVPG